MKGGGDFRNRTIGSRGAESIGRTHLPHNHGGLDRSDRQDRYPADRWRDGHAWAGWAAELHQARIAQGPRPPIEVVRAVIAAGWSQERVPQPKPPWAGGERFEE